MTQEQRNYMTKAIINSMPLILDLQLSLLWNFFFINQNLNEFKIKFQF